MSVFKPHQSYGCAAGYPQGGEAVALLLTQLYTRLLGAFTVAQCLQLGGLVPLRL